MTKEVDDFLERHKPRLQQPGDITRKMAVEKWGVSPDTALQWLDALTVGEKPELERIEGVLLENRKVGTVWRIIQKPE